MAAWMPQMSLFHTSERRAGRRRRRFSNVRAAEMGLVDEDAISRFSKEYFPSYSTEDKEALRDKYTAAQLAAVEAGEAAVDVRDLTVQGRLRTDGKTTGLQYVEDFSQVQPVIDKRARTDAAEAEKPAVTSAAAAAIGSRFMGEEAFGLDLMRWLESFVPTDVNLAGLTDEQLRAVAEEHGPKDEDLMRWWFDRPALVQRDGRTPVPAGATGGWGLAPSLGTRLPGVTEHYQRQEDPEDEGLDEAGDYRELKRQTGLQVQEMMKLAVKTLVIRHVHNQTRLGKVRSVSVMVIAGNGEGRLGLGMAKAKELPLATSKAKVMAVRNMLPVPRYENRTVFGTVQAKVGGTVVQLSARPPGFGLRVPHRIFEMARAVGITDLAASIPRSRNPMNTVKAAYQALMQQPNPEDIAIGRGKKLVDVRKVYYGGAVY
ncbi:37S ribosomal protein s5 [Grosmannia clavigera kw1407]|uniref:Small ribosomal subunit protein uS5m n=1 Tax=Grosmannia clavigera (strain kw1407 / UAMH 11150) TaxID=655863 RepID=F0XDF6_GROCL|nr:37S ribosomal protein s5 [Grosmannia clavigera kw1407]EFX03605.1 37S ribosomal protein s5 [Grosmannia clavigera kw1407]